MPPTAATTGTAAFLTVDSCPATSSRLISSPTTKKNTTISRSLIQCWTDSANVASPHARPTFV